MSVIKITSLISFLQMFRLINNLLFFNNKLGKNFFFLEEKNDNGEQNLKKTLNCLIFGSEI